jgi:hypothetical protein
LVRQHWSARRLRFYCAAPIIASIGTAIRAGVSVIAPSTIGWPNEPTLLARRLASSHTLLRALVAFAAEEEQMPAEGLLPDHLLGLRRQADEPGAQIDRATGEERLGLRRQADHVAPFIARSTHDSAFSFTKVSTLTRAPFGSTNLNRTNAAVVPLMGRGNTPALAAAAVLGLLYRDGAIRQTRQRDERRHYRRRATTVSLPPPAGATQGEPSGEPRRSRLLFFYTRRADRLPLTSTPRRM